MTSQCLRPTASPPPCPHMTRRRRPKQPPWRPQLWRWFHGWGQMLTHLFLSYSCGLYPFTYRLLTFKVCYFSTTPPSWLVRTKQVVVISHRGSTRALSHVEMIVLMISEFYRLNELKEQLHLLEAFLGMFFTRFGTSKHHRSWSCSVHRVIVTWVISLDLKHTNLPALTGK